MRSIPKCQYFSIPNSMTSLWRYLLAHYGFQFVILIFLQLFSNRIDYTANNSCLFSVSILPFIESPWSEPLWPVLTFFFILDTFPVREAHEKKILMIRFVTASKMESMQKIAVARPINPRDPWVRYHNSRNIFTIKCD